jgi:hypothetical protein
VARIWKNGIATALSKGTNNAGITGVFVLDTDVYAAGYEYNGIKYVAKVWKNGVGTALTDGTNGAAAYSVFVK